MQRLARTWLLTVSGAVALMTSGCVSVSMPRNLTKAFHKPGVDKISYEEEVTEVPAKLKNPEELNYHYARYMEDIGQLDEAKSKYLEVLKTQPDNVPATLGLARIEYAHGLTSEAEKKFHKAVRLAPDLAEAQYELGRFYASELNWQAAIGPLQAAMVKAPDQDDYHFQLAVALVHTGDIGSALPHFIHTVGDAEAHFNVAMILKDQGELDLAEKHFLLAVMKKPEFEQAKYWLGQLRGQRGNLEPGSPSKILPAGSSQQAAAHSFSYQPRGSHARELVLR